jgi:TetR/AcrR family transcriptional regulator
MGQVRHHAHADTDARQHIAEAAAELFAERGFDGTSMQMIADAAAVNKAMLYYYYASKRGLYSAIIQGGLETMSGLLDEITAMPGLASARVGEFARRIYRLLETKRAVGRIIDRELMGLGEGVTPPLRERLLADMAKLEGF